MALVTRLEEVGKDRQSIHRPTRCYCSSVSGPDGERYLQLDTVGSNDREIKGKVSQTIQFDRQAAGQLIQALLRTFPELCEELPQESPKEEDADSEVEGHEGRTLLRRHLFRERNARIIKRKKRAVLAAEGRLRCEVCEFDFEATFGPLGRGFAECHHLVPLASLAGPVATGLDDLAIVCSNCHRMLHRRPFRSLQDLRCLLRERRALEAAEAK